jgi:hypothetical protein
LSSRWNDVRSARSLRCRLLPETPSVRAIASIGRAQARLERGTEIAESGSPATSPTRRRADYTLTLQSGTGQLTGDSLTLNLAWKLEGSVAGVSVAGRATESLQAESK